ncbi:hypothetical protein IH982_03450 [Patescibacteria group bacterium]|nr:hypothetical protein [Patescibacteria group bacterium]
MAQKKTNLMLSVERHFKQPLEQLLPAMINDQEESDLQEIASQLDVSKATLNYWFLKLGINVRKVALAPGETLEITRVS